MAPLQQSGLNESLTELVFDFHDVSTWGKPIFLARVTVYEASVFRMQ